MGAGSSSSKEPAGSAQPACPLFYNYTPTGQLIPGTTLPTRDGNGNVRRPPGGCAARVIALRDLPVVTSAAKKQAKEVLALAAKEKGRRHSNDEATEEEMVAKAILDSPSLTPAVSSCFLINIAVDEQGRLAPLTSGGATALTDTLSMADGTDFASAGAESVPVSPQSQTPSAARRGFNFDSANNTAHATPQPGGTSPRAPPTRAPPQAEGGTATGGGHHQQPGSVPSPTHGRSAGAVPPLPSSSDDVTPMHRTGAAGGGSANTAATPPAPLGGMKAPPATLSPSPPPPGARAGSGDVEDGSRDSSLLTSSVRSLLIKDSRFRRSGEGTDGAAAAAAAAGHNGDPANRGLRRQNSRIKLLQIPNRTRWYLFNDSRTHEAQITVLFCYIAYRQVPLSGMGAVVKEGDKDSDEEGNNGGSEKPVPGELRIMCKATPIASASAAANGGKKVPESMSSSSSSFVEIQNVLVPSFISTISATASGEQREQLDALEKGEAKLAAVRLFVVLAPGATVYLAEGEVLGYCVSTHMVPFSKNASMAVLGRMLTPDLVRSLKDKGEAVTRDGYRHKLTYLNSLDEIQKATSSTEAGGAMNFLPAIPPSHSAALPSPAAGRQTPSPAASSPLPAPPSPPPAPPASKGATGSALNSSPALPPIRPVQNPAPAATGSAPIATSPSSHAPAAAAAAAAPAPARSPLADVAPNPPPPSMQHRLSRRPQSGGTAATAAQPEKKKAADADSTVAAQPSQQQRKKRIGSMLRDPRPMAVPEHVEMVDINEPSPPREMSSRSSLAISF